MSSTATGRELALWKWGLIFVTIWAILYVALVKESWIEREIQLERAGTHAVLGAVAAGEAEAAAKAVWYPTFVHSRVIEASYQIFTPGVEHDEGDAGINRLIKPVREWAAARLNVAWSLLYQLIVRLCVVGLWWKFALVVAIPCAVDGVVMRKVKALTFGMASPTLYVAARHAMVALPLLSILLLLSPMRIHPLAAPIIIVGISAALWLTIAHFAKRA
ncbi:MULTISPECIES: DUF4400 domain-containing protein [unclassified Rhodanobacter]|uniref:DUF4400 domain-containing protein n=1 Tax=unclassified Rhodanobacter TaxID=2621553 RepID=UPI0007AA1720|nr:DUF4400 domain-containing protein [Rhodanobacter sp. FW510-R10]KZC32575.1 hypothetical protein RhoFW510R10_11715 [Rhodanobacter sp. FW510-R10]